MAPTWMAGAATSRRATVACWSAVGCALALAGCGEERGEPPAKEEIARVSASIERAAVAAERAAAAAERSAAVVEAFTARTPVVPDAPAEAAKGKEAARGGRPAKGHEAFERLLEQSIEAAAEGKYAGALSSCEQAAGLQPDDQRVSTTCALAACRLKSADKARVHYARISSQTRQQAVHQICLQEGIADL